MTNNESVVGPDQKRLPQGGWNLLESGAANRQSTVGAGVMRADGLMARSASSADESESAKLPMGSLSEVERRSLFTKMTDELLSRESGVDGDQVSFAAEMLDSMISEGVVVIRAVQEVFDPEKSPAENMRAAEVALTAQFKNGLNERESDGQWHPMKGVWSDIPKYLNVVVLANCLLSVSEDGKCANRMREVIKNGMTEEEVDNFLSLRPEFRVFTDENGQEQIEYRVVGDGEVRGMMEDRTTHDKVAEKPSGVPNPQPESNQPAANHEAEGSQESSLPLGDGELRRLFRGISDNLDSNKTADRHQALGWSKKFPCREELGGAARELDGMIGAMRFGNSNLPGPLLQRTFDPELSVRDNLQKAVDYWTEVMKRDLDGRNSDGRRYPVSVVNYPGLVTALFAQKLYETCTQNPDGARNMIKNVVDNPNEDGDRIIDTLSAMRPVYSIDTEGNVKWEFFDSGTVNKMMKKRKEGKAAARDAENSPSQVEDRIKESAGSSQPEPEESQPADREIGHSRESLSSEEQVKLINRMLHDAVYNRADRENPNEFTVSMALHILNSAVQDGQGLGFLRGVYVPGRSIEGNVSKAVQKLTAEFVEDGIGDRTDGRWYALDTNSANSLKEAVVAEILSAYLCDPEKAAEARRMIAEGLSDDQKDSIMLKGKHLGFTYRHGRVRWSLIGEERLQEEAKPFSLKERLDFVTDLREDLQDQKRVGDKDFDIRERKEKLATVLEYLQEEISAAMEPGYLPDEEREFLEKQFSERPGWRPEITPELYLSRVLALKALGAEQSLKSGWTDQPDDYRIKKLAHSIYREFGDEEAAGRTDKIEWAYNQNMRLRRMAENGDVQELLKLVD